MSTTTNAALGAVKRKKTSKKHVPKPGSDDAQALGCTCPVLDNHRGEGYLGMKNVFVFSGGCPVHHRKAAKR